MKMKKKTACLVFGGVGFLYGAFLSAIGILFAGAGHGSYVPIEVFSSPLMRIGVMTSFFGGPFMWTFIWALVAISIIEPRNKKSTCVAMLCLATHYFGIVYTFMSADHSEMVKLRAFFNPQNLDLVGIAIAVFPFVVYFLGQALLCVLLYRSHSRQVINGVHIGDELL